MSNQKIDAGKITKPIQLLAVWFIGLILLVSSLLAGAATISSPSWIPAFLAISAVSIIPLFLLFIFLLQTKFRPQMQADEYYHKYLDAQTGTEIIETKDSNSPLPKQETLVLPELEKQKQILELKSNILQEDILALKTLLKNNNQLEEAQELLSNTERNAEKLIDFAKASNVSIKVNKKIIGIENVYQKLKQNGFDLSQFGEKDLEYKVLSFGINITPEILTEVINYSREINFQYITIIRDRVFTDRYRNNVFLGSYANPFQNSNRSFKPFNEETLNRIRECNSVTDLHNYFSN